MNSYSKKSTSSTTSSSSTSTKYSPSRILAILKSTYLECNKKIKAARRKSGKHYNKVSKVNPILGLANYIVTSFNNYVTDENKYVMYPFIEKFEKVFADSHYSWKDRIEHYTKICNDFINKTVKFTGINLIVNLSGDIENMDINPEDMYYLFNTYGTVINVIQLNPNTFAIMYLNTKDAKKVHDTVNHKELEDEDKSYKLKTLFIEPQVQCLTKHFSWETKKEEQIVVIPYATKAFEIPLREVIGHSKHAKAIMCK